jgi:hypothetical protein
MEKSLLSILLLVSATLYAQECTQSELSESTEDFDSPISYMQENNENDIDYEDFFDAETSLRLDELELYNNELNRFLSESDDIKIQLSAFNSLYEKNFNIDVIKNVLKKAITPSSDRYTIFLADSLCHNKKELTDWCHHQKIHEIHREIDPENVYTYLFSLNENDIKNNTQVILDEAAYNSTYSDSFFYEYILEKAEKIESFNDANPTLFNEYSSIASPNNDKDYMQEIKKTISSQQLIEKGIVPSDFMQHLNESTSIINAIGMEMATPMSFGEIVRSCQTLDNTDSCLDIGKALMKDKTLLSQMIGTAIITEVQKQLTTDEEIISESKALMDGISKQHMCYVQISDVMYAMMSNKKFITQYINDAKSIGELKAYKNLAYAVYNTEKQNGFNPDFNPNDRE